jgi:EAL and modified HD-GYP domain-containing signal transduction protein
VLHQHEGEFEAPVSALLDAPDEGPISSFAVRRPLIGVHGEVVGFEFRLSEALEGRLKAHPTALSAYALSLLSSVRPTIDSGRTVLLTLPADVVLRPAVVDQVPAGVWLVINPWMPEQSMPEGLAELHVKGVRIGRVPYDQPIAAVSADFVRLSWQRDRPEALWDQISEWRHHRPGIPLVVTDVDNIDDLERVLRSDVKFACGRVDSGLNRAAAKKQRPVQPGTVRLCQLLNEIMTVETPQLAADISADVVLSYKLLRFANSPALGFSRAVESIEQAVMILGRQELYRWISILLLAGADGRSASRALQEIALWRARLLEGLAQFRDRADEPPSALFTVGLLSLLDAMLQVSLDEALQPLRLGDAALAALLKRSGPWAPYMLLMSDLEAHNTEAARRRADEFGGFAKVLELSDAAWQWAAEATGHSHAPPPDVASSAA